MKAAIIKQGYIVFALDAKSNQGYKIRKFLKEQDAKDFAKFDLPTYSDAEIKNMANNYDPSKFYERHQDNGNVTYDYKVRIRIGKKEENFKLFIERPEEYK